MKSSFRMALGVLGLSLAAAAFSLPATGAVQGWLDWRGPNQNSTSTEKGLPQKIDGKQTLWTTDLPGQSTPVIANGKLYINGFEGDGPDLREVIACFDAETGKLFWKYAFNDFLSDIIYLRYSTSSPTIDPETGNVYMQGTQGILACFTADGKWLWEHSLMEEYGRMTFPNARTASPMVDKDLVITRGITSNWGAQGAPGDRFYAFDKKTGELVWSSTPGGRPQDNTFSHPMLTWWNGKRVIYSAAGDSSLVSLNARTGEPIWRVPTAKSGAKGGVNAAVIVYGDTLITVHESENLDSSEVGRMAAFKIPQSVTTTNPNEPVVYTPKELEIWRNGVGSLASSPVLVGDTLYEMSGTGDLCAVNAKSGKVLWKKKLGIEQRQSTPFYADGLLYVAMYISAGDPSAQTGGEAGTTGDLFVIKPGEDGCEIISQTQLHGKCFGSPIGYNGKVYVQTDRKLYCFGKAGNNPGLPSPLEEKPSPKAGAIAKLQVIPSEVLMKPGGKTSFRIRGLDVNGMVAQENIDPKSVKWASYIPPTALVKSSMKGSFNAAGELAADDANEPSAGAFMATLGNARGIIRGRVLSYLPIKQDFEAFELSQTTTNFVEEPTKFAYPPLPWSGARLRFEVREKDGNKALVKTIENKLLQRGTTFFGHSDMKNYTIEADVLTEGNRRKMSEVGVINQRYAIILKGNSQQFEINSNQERIKEAVPFKWTANAWYRIKARVDVASDGSGVVRAKAWPKGEAEPDKWLIEVKHKHAHPMGNPGLFSFAPQEMRTWIDNVSVTHN
ncbi:MAG TPA: PQQ-binding-like beta-propeller repeat protein [Candidatus Acidoferrum sp.]|nr:PQQ-binding-like beta-propeller repeat protein [Candidatus Acidoferrum sp.]